jgi:hypothetical protein
VQPAARTDPRTGAALTAAQVTALIRDSAAVQVSAGCELLDVGLNVLADLSDFLVGGSVGRDPYATLHGTATLSLAQELDWGTAILRPYLVLSDGTVTARFNLGAYLTSSPTTVAGSDPITHDITGYDILHWLNTPVGEAYVVAAGTGYLAAAEAILLAQGITAYLIDQDRAASVLAAPRVWVLDQRTTWLNVVNDLLAGVGYQGLWSDWDGRLRMTPYLLPSARASEWLYGTDVASSMLGPDRAVTRDFFNAPNRWVFYWSQDPSGAAPVDGAGLYTYVNQANGPTSVASRGRVITAAPQQLDVVDQTALVAAAQSKIDADLRLATTIDMPVAPNPLHWHFDRVTVDDPGVGPLAEVLVVKWSLPLDGGDGAQVWSVL